MLLGSCTCLLYMHVVSVYCGGGRRNDYSNEWLLEADLSPHEVQKLAAKYGMEYSHEVLSFAAVRAVNLIYSLLKIIIINKK